MLITCLPAGASESSTIVGTTGVTNGLREYLPRGVEGAVARRLVRGDVHLEGGREGPERVDLAQQLRRQVFGCDEATEERRRRGIRGHGPGAEGPPVGGAHARD